MNWKKGPRTILLILCLASLSFLGGCGLFGDSGYIPQDPYKTELPKFHHPMNVPWKGREDVYFKRYSDYMTTSEKKVYLNTPLSKRWDLFHDKFLLYQELESLLELSQVKLAPNKLLQYYQSNSLQKGLFFLEKNGFKYKKNTLEGEKK